MGTGIRHAGHLYAQALDAAGVRLGHFDGDTGGVFDHFAAHRHPAQKHEDQTAQRVDLFLVHFLGIGQGLVDLSLEFLKRGLGEGKVDAGAFLRPELSVVEVVLVLDLADDLFDQVFDGDKAIHPAVFVDHQRHVPPITLHFLQQDADGHGGRHVEQRAQGILEREPPALAVEPVFEREILEVDHADGGVECALKNRQAGHAAVAKNLNQIILGDVRGDRNDFGLGGGDILDRHVAQVAHTGACVGWVAVGDGLIALGIILAVGQDPYDAAEKSALILVDLILSILPVFGLRAVRRVRGVFGTVAHCLFCPVGGGHGPRVCP